MGGMGVGWLWRGVVLVCACERRVGWSVVGVYRSEWCQRRDEKRVVSRSYVSKVADQRSRGK